MRRQAARALVLLSLALTAAARGLLDLAERAYPTRVHPTVIYGIQYLIDRPMPVSEEIALATILRERLPLAQRRLEG